MEENFTLPIPYRGRQFTVDFTFRRLGYTYKISTVIQDKEILFEPDEEGSFRATLAFPTQGHQGAPIDRYFIEAIITALTQTFKV